MLLSPSLVVDTINPVNRAHPWAPDAWWLCVPGLMGGAVWHDIMSLPGDLRQGHHARLQGIAARPSATSGWQEGTQAPGGFGALAVDGAGDYADAGDHGFLSAGLSAMMWVVDLLPRSSASFPGLVCKGNLDSATSGSYVLYMASGQYYWIVWTGSTQTVLAGAGGITVGAWQQVVATWQRSGPMATFVNGAKRSQGTGTNALVDSPAFSLLLGTAQGNGGPAAYPLNALLGSVRFYRNRVLSDQAIQEMYWHSRAGSPGLLRRVRPRLASAGSLLVAVGQATETDTAQGMAWAPKARLVGQATETDLAQGLAWSPQARLVAQGSETDLAQAIASAMGSDTIPVAQVSETDTSQALTWAPQQRLVGQSSEADLAQPILWAPQTRLVTQASETDLAQAITSAMGSDSIPVAQASETDLAQAITWAPQHRLVGQVSESDLAQAILWSPKHRLLALVSETDLAQALTVSQGADVVAVGQASESDLAQAILWHPQRRLVGQVTETDLAQALTAVLTMNTWILDDVVIAFTAHIFALPATPAWMAAAQHAATLAQLTGSYSPVLRVHLPAFDRIFSTHPTLFGDEPLLARLDQGGVGAVTRDLDEITGQARLGGSSFALLNQTGFQETFGTAPFLNSLAYIELGFIELAAADFLRIFTGVIDRDPVNLERLDFALVDSSVKDSVNLNVPISVDLFPNAPSESRNANVPIFLGVHTNAPTVQVSGLAATGRLAVAMDADSVTVILTEDAAHFPLASTATVGAEAISYLRRALINREGKTYVEFSGLTRAAPVGHAVNAVITLTDLNPTYLTGFGVDTVNAARVNGAVLGAGGATVSVLVITGHPVPIVRLTAIPDPDAIVTVDVNAEAPLLPFSVPLPPDMIDIDLSLVLNGGFETGNLTGWTVINAAVAAVRTSGFAPAGFTGTSCVELRRGLAGFFASLHQDIAVTVGERYAYSVQYRNTEAAAVFVPPQGFTEVKSQATLHVGTPADSGLYHVHFLTSTNAWVTQTGSFVATEATARLTLFSYYVSIIGPVSTFFDTATLVHSPAPVVGDQLINGSFDTGVATPWVTTGTVEAFNVSNGDDVGVSPFEGGYLATLRGGHDAPGGIVQDMVTVVGERYAYRVTSYNRHQTFVEQSATRRYFSQASLTIGTPETPALYVSGLIGAPNAWHTADGTFIANTTTTRLTVLSQYGSTGASVTPFPSFVDAISLELFLPVTPDLANPTLYHNDGENPVDVILYMLALFYPQATYNLQAFITAREQLANMRFRGLLTNPGDSGTLLQRMGFQCTSLVLRNPRGEYDITVLDNTRPIAAVFDEANIVTQGENPPVSTFQKASVPIDSLYTSFYVYFDTFVGGSTSPGDYAGVVYATPAETTAPGGEVLVAACLSAQTLYGRDHRFDFYADFVRDLHTAHILLAWLVSRHALRQDTYAWRAWLDAVPLQLGQVISVAHPVLANADAVVPSELVQWHYLPGDMEVELTAQTLGPSFSLDGPRAENTETTTPLNTDAPVDLSLVVTPGPAGELDLDSVDLDPAKPGRQTSVTDPASPAEPENPLKGTFVVDDEGVVTFVPALGFSGLSVASYTIKDDKGHTSNVATISVTVEPEFGWTLLQTFVEPVDALLETGIHIINAFAFFSGEIQRLVAVTGDPSLVGATGEVGPPPPTPPGFNDVLTSSRLLAAPLNGTGEPFGRTSFLGSAHTTTAGNAATALVNVCFYGQHIYVAYNTADSTDDTVNSGPVIYSLINLDDFEDDSFAATWFEEQEWGAEFVRVGAMLTYDTRLYVALEPAVPATGSLDIWRYDNTTWAFHASLGTTVSRLRSFATFDGVLYGGADGTLYTTTGGAWTAGEVFTGVIDALAVPVTDDILYVNVRNGSDREIWTTTDGIDYVLLHTLPNEMSLLPGVMAFGADDNLYVSILDGTETRVYVYDGVTWAISRDWGDAFVGVSALFAAADNRLYAGLVRRLHASATTNNLPDAEIWYLSIDLG